MQKQKDKAVPVPSFMGQQMQWLVPDLNFLGTGGSTASQSSATFKFVESSVFTLETVSGSMFSTSMCMQCARSIVCILVYLKRFFFRQLAMLVLLDPQAVLYFSVALLVVVWSLQEYMLLEVG